MTESTQTNKKPGAAEHTQAAVRTGTAGETDFGGPLYRELLEYGRSDYYGFHMPGHKRKTGKFENPYGFDITEIDGFDDLHHPEKDGILQKAQERAARLYGAEETHFLINGSTGGILSAVSGCTHRGGRILMARNCHRSVYHGAELGNLKVNYLYPRQIVSPGINGAVCPEDVEKALEEASVCGGVEAVVITSPTYDGICSDVRAIGQCCHRYGVPLIVDQAHGAHFPFSEYFPEDAVSAGADVVIHSVHKTLPSLTQTALLHIQGGLADRERIRHFLSVYQSSSPSYVLIASIDACMELLENRGKELFSSHVEKLEAFRRDCRDLKILKLAGEEFCAGNFGNKRDSSKWEEGLCRECAAADFDRSKLLISTDSAGITGSRLSKLLLERYHLQMEMSAPGYIVGIASLADTEEGFSRLGAALHELDWELESKGSRRRRSGQGPQEILLPAFRAELPAGEAQERKKEYSFLTDCAGRVSGSYVYLYPPGIPLLVPGEVITREAAEQIRIWTESGFDVHGLSAEKQLLTICD